MDISPDRHSVEIGRQGLKSIARARDFLDQELLKCKTPCFRRARKAEEEEEEEEEAQKEEMAASGGSNQLLQDMESTPGLFFVVEERSAAGPGSGPERRSATRNGSDTREAAPGGGPRFSLPDSSNTRGGTGAIKKEELGSGSSGGGSVDGDVDGYDGGGSARAAATGNSGGYSVPYWGLLRIGDQAYDPGEKPEPWPLHGDAVSGSSARGVQQAQGLGISRSQLPPPSQVHRPANVPDSVGYRIRVINVKVSIHHPRGSEVAANKDAVIAGVTRVRKRERCK